MSKADPILRVRDLTARIVTRKETFQAVRGISFDIGAGEAVGFVGESGCGKSVTARALMRLAPEGTAIALDGAVDFHGQDLLRLGEVAMRDIRGRRIAMVFQDPMTSLNPVMSIGAQIDDIVCRHMGLSRREARQRTVELLASVGIPDAAHRADDYPHQFSGGMRQRVLIAVAISCDPELLIADEPTTALDVTVQAQILRLLLRLRDERGMSLMLITHDFGVVAGMVERVNVMYGGEIVEAGPVEQVFHAPGHAYTRALLDAVPRLDSAGQKQ
ncbi:ABC transporter ATP-binding protein [Nitratireductor pacificus]|uniref:Oligopeptide ABC transporter ATP-binding protein n=1 Tax=Nitratireductor pacificus pht-3B TaxID=391937 RepID=K2MMM6_9HYPH|nr:ABC transporter ATP-binding protein [Nitratireductor pacificus]EKF18502.1 oligopeptide ABC transporter ATP-binding protein [Nitratireductor pacificus pht-3B]